MYRNGEGYSDVTAGEAIANITREEKRQKQEAMDSAMWQRAIVDGAQYYDPNWLTTAENVFT